MTILRWTALYAHLAVFVWLSCSPHPAVTAHPGRSAVAGERIYVAPFVNNASFDSLPGWPRERREREVLLRTLDRINQRFLDEARECARIGLYEVVDDSSSATVILAVSLVSCAVTGDVFSMPVSVTIRRREGQKQQDSVVSVSIPVPHAAHIADPTQCLHIYGELLAGFAGQVPYRSLLSMLCERRDEGVDMHHGPR